MSNLYFDAINDKVFTQIKTDLFANAIRKNMDSFQRAREDLKGKVEGKEVAMKIMSDLNQNLKRKYIKKQLSYKKVCRGEHVDEANNFFQ